MKKCFVFAKPKGRNNKLECTAAIIIIVIGATTIITSLTITSKVLPLFAQLSNLSAVALLTVCFVSNFFIVLFLMSPFTHFVTFSQIKVISFQRSYMES